MKSGIPVLTTSPGKDCNARSFDNVIRAYTLPSCSAPLWTGAWSRIVGPVIVLAISLAGSYRLLPPKIHPSCIASSSLYGSATTIIHTPTGPDSRWPPSLLQCTLGCYPDAMLISEGPGQPCRRTPTIRPVRTQMDVLCDAIREAIPDNMDTPFIASDGSSLIIDGRLCRTALIAMSLIILRHYAAPVKATCNTTTSG